MHTQTRTKRWIDDGMEGSVQPKKERGGGEQVFVSDLERYFRVIMTVKLPTHTPTKAWTGGQADE